MKEKKTKPTQNWGAELNKVARQIYTKDVNISEIMTRYKLDREYNGKSERTALYRYVLLWLIDLRMSTGFYEKQYINCALILLQISLKKNLDEERMTITRNLINLYCKERTKFKRM